MQSRLWKILFKTGTQLFYYKKEERKNYYKNDEKNKKTKKRKVYTISLVIIKKNKNGSSWLNGNGLFVYSIIIIIKIFFQKWLI